MSQSSLTVRGVKTKLQKTLDHQSNTNSTSYWKLISFEPNKAPLDQNIQIPSLFSCFCLNFKRKLKRAEVCHSDVLAKRHSRTPGDVKHKNQTPQWSTDIDWAKHPGGNQAMKDASVIPVFLFFSPQCVHRCINVYSCLSVREKRQVVNKSLKMLNVDRMQKQLKEILWSVANGKDE